MNRPNFDARQLREAAKPIAELLSQRDGIDADIKEYYDAAKEKGIDTASLRKAISELRKPPKNRDTVDLYKDALQPDLFQRAT